MNTCDCKGREETADAISGRNPAPEKRLLFDAAHVRRSIEAIASAICDEFFCDTMTPVAFLGLQTNGIPLGRRIAAIIREKTGYDAPVGALDISMYRDDLGTRRVLPPIRETLIPFDLEDRVVILTDGVLQTGRSVRAALDAITGYGRPALIRLAVLVDRGLREFPIRADYTGNIINLPANERVNTEWSEYDGTDGVYATLRPEALAGTDPGKDNHATGKE